jgi:antitoxin CcdA
MGKVELKFEIDEMLAEQMRAANIHAAILFEQALKAALGPEAAEKRAAAWATDNAEAIESHNRFVRDHGVFGEDLRSW